MPKSGYLLLLPWALAFFPAPAYGDLNPSEAAAYFDFHNGTADLAKPGSRLRLQGV